MDSNVLVAMSGGVDSAVAALILHRQGLSCRGVTMNLKAPETENAACQTDDDARTAAAVAAALGFPHETVDYTARFRETVIADFIATYCRGETPNPCIVCNRTLKFGMLLDYADAVGAAKIATGHYVRTSFDPASGRYLLLRGIDPRKDQSYVLYTLSQKMLSRAVFPLGGMEKTAVRAMAKEAGLSAADRPESQDICFIPDGDYAAYIERTAGVTFEDGNFTDEAGTVLGRHRGIIRYTVGQRKGLGLSLKAPLYVKELCVPENRVILAPETALYTDVLTASSVNLIALPQITGALRVQAKVRYRQPEQWATVWQTGDDTLRVEFDAPQRAVTRGQSVVLYDGDTVIGGGRITRTGNRGDL